MKEERPESVMLLDGAMTENTQNLVKKGNLPAKSPHMTSNHKMYICVTVKVFDVGQKHMPV